MKTIGVYGGSFNPFHNGHLLAIDVFKRELSLDLLLLIPAGTPPHKTLAQNSPDAQTRLRMAQLATHDIDGVKVDDLEICRKGKSFTYDTLCELRHRYPDDRLILLMGTDMFLSFTEWHRFEEIFALAELAVMPRSAQRKGELEQIQALSARFTDKYHARVHILSTEFLEMSSTLVRRMLFFGCGDGYVPDAVFTEIQRQGLYSATNCRGLSVDELTKTVAMLYEPRRYRHAIGCRNTAVHLAEKYGEDSELAARAGILHDITKALGKTEQLRLCDKFKIALSDGCVRDVLHGYTAAEAAKNIFGECDAVCSAIRWHTTGRADMTKLEKIIYLADYIEPNRDFDGVAELRKLADQDLDAAMLRGLEMSICDLKERGKAIDPHSAAAYAHLLAERNG